MTSPVLQLRAGAPRDPNGPTVFDEIENWTPSTDADFAFLAMFNRNSRRLAIRYNRRARALRPAGPARVFVVPLVEFPPAGPQQLWARPVDDAPPGQQATARPSAPRGPTADLSRAHPRGGLPVMARAAGAPATA